MAIGHTTFSQSASIRGLAISDTQDSSLNPSLSPRTMIVNL